VLTVDGRSIGEELGRFYLKDELAGKSDDGPSPFSTARDGRRTVAKRAIVAQFAEMSNDSERPS
jgi:hypothetical protein